MIKKDNDKCLVVRHVISQSDTHNKAFTGLCGYDAKRLYKITCLPNGSKLL